MGVTASVFLLLNQARRRDFAESFATEVIRLRSGRAILRKIRRAGSSVLSKQNQKLRTEVSDPHVTFSRARAPAPHFHHALVFTSRTPGKRLVGSRLRARGDGQARCSRRN